MSELKKANQNGTIAGLDALFAKYGIETSNTSSKNSNYSDFDKLFYK